MENEILQEEISTVVSGEEIILESEENITFQEEAVISDTQSSSDIPDQSIEQDNEILDGLSVGDHSIGDHSFGDHSVGDHSVEYGSSTDSGSGTDSGSSTGPGSGIVSGSITDPGSVSENDISYSSVSVNSIFTDSELPGNTIVYMTAQEKSEIPFFESDINSFSRSETMLFLILCMLIVIFIHNIFKGSHWFKKIGR